MKKTQISQLIRIGVCIAVVALIVGIGAATGWITFDEFKAISFDFSSLVKVLVMALAVVAVTTLITFILSLFHPRSHRAQSMLSIISRLL
ncbi:MAG: hypothetical protein IK047_04140 [Clostridia bacterium]|nr:hypothetical protein [Clostridia bacterium]